MSSMSHTTLETLPDDVWVTIFKYRRQLRSLLALMGTSHKCRDKATRAFLRIYNVDYRKFLDKRKDTLTMECGNGNVDMCRIWLDAKKKWPFDLETDFGQGIGSAISRGHMEVVKLLINEGTHLESTVKSCDIHCAAMNGHMDMVKFILAKCGTFLYDPSDEIFDALEGENTKQLTARLQKLMILEIWNFRSSYVRYAAARGYLELVEVCLHNFEGVYLEDRDAAIDGATKNGHVEIVRLLELYTQRH